jgi:alpha-glucosidase (family GH31 glycosyl hydrolase)
MHLLLPGMAILAWGCSESLPGWDVRQTTDGISISAREARLDVYVKPVSFRLFRDDMLVLASAPGRVADAFTSISIGTGDAVPPVASARLASSSGQSVVLDLLDETGSPVGTLEISPSAPASFRLTLRPAAISGSFGFTFDIASGRHFYGQGQLTEVKNPREELWIPTSQHFPLDAGSYERPVLTSDEGTNVACPFWLTATGAAIFSDTYSDLSVSFNRDANGRFRLHLLPRYGETVFQVDLLTADNTRDAYLAWVRHSWQNRPPLPLGARPPDDLFTRPIWTTWALFKQNINQLKVQSFFDDIQGHGLDVGYIEIDDKWTPEWGDLEFDPVRFPDPEAMIERIHAGGSKVSAWIPPFVMRTAESFQSGLDSNAYVTGGDPETGADPELPFLVAWWNSIFMPMAGIIDFSRPEAGAWFGDRIDSLVERYGVDGFKYDAGETQFLPKPADFPAGFLPNQYPDAYARWAMNHRPVEMRAGWFAQDLPVAFRQFDKNSHWGLDNGLASVLTQYLAMGLIGYPFILPDMVGGNEYGGAATDELFIRWVQLNALLPMVQYSVVPWRDGFGPEVLEATLAMEALRKRMSDVFLALADEAAATQLPMVRPLFFEFPADQATYGIGDQFMLGDRYLAAPVLVKGAVSRDVYLPEGTWKALDNDDEQHEGPVLLGNYPAPLERLPAFERLSPK